jgi:protein-tyrosine phosphatase
MAELNKTPFASHFLEYHLHEGNGFFGYVYSANGKGDEIDDRALDAEGNLSSSKKVYLKPDYKDNKDRWFNGELHYQFQKEPSGDGYSNGDKYENLLSLIDGALDVLVKEDQKEEGAEPMMVHCSSGVERSVTTVIAIIIRWFQRHSIAINDELVTLVADFIRTRRPTAATFEDTLPNPGLRSVHEMRKQLIQYLVNNPPQHDGGGGGGGSK